MCIWDVRSIFLEKGLFYGFGIVPVVPNHGWEAPKDLTTWYPFYT